MGAKSRSKRGRYIQLNLARELCGAALLGYKTVLEPEDAETLKLPLWMRQVGAGVGFELYRGQVVDVDRQGRITIDWSITPLEMFKLEGGA